MSHDRDINYLLVFLWPIPKQSKQKHLWKTCNWHPASPTHYTDVLTPFCCAVLLADVAPNQYSHVQKHLQLISSPFNPSQQDANWGKLWVGPSLWLSQPSSFWFRKYHKRPGGSTATLIRHIRQLTWEYLQRTLRLSLYLAQEINNSPDRYNPWQIWAMGVESMKVGRACLWIVHRVGLTEAIKLLRLVCRKLYHSFQCKGKVCK